MPEKETALITGASSGIGAALARAAAADGLDLILSARRSGPLEELAAELSTRHGVRVLVITSDLSQPDGADSLFNATAASGWRVDHLINNAGFGRAGAVADVPEREQTDLFQVNVLSLTHLCRLFLPGMISRGRGGVLNVASVAAYLPGPYMAAYYASKACVLSYTRALAYELRRTGVRACAVCPGPTATEFFREAGGENARLAKGPVMTAEEVARAAWRGYLRRRKVVIPGWKNKLTALSCRLFPAALTLRVAAVLNRD